MLYLTLLKVVLVCTFTAIAYCPSICATSTIPADGDTLSSPTDSVKTITIDDLEYISGSILITEEKDTTLLKPYGFRNFRFHIRKSSGIFDFNAVWPSDLDLNSLPSQLVTVRFQRPIEPEPTEPVEEVEELPPYKKPPVSRLWQIGPPPDDFLFFAYEGNDYANGWLILDEDNDTTLLNEFGFEHFRFHWKDSTQLFMMRGGRNSFRGTPFLHSSKECATIGMNIFDQNLVCRQTLLQ